MKTVVELNISKVKKVVALLKKYSGMSFVTTQECAKELEISKIKFLQFLDEHKDYFWLQERWTYRQKIKTDINPWTKIKTKTPYSEKSRSLGICINEVYEEIHLNPTHISHIDHLIKKYYMYVHVEHIDYYGVMGYKIIQSSAPSESYEHNYYQHKHKWLNSPEKLKRIDELIERKTTGFTFGGLGDSYNSKISGVVTNDDLDILIKNGWTMNKITPLGH